MTWKEPKRAISPLESRVTEDLLLHFFVIILADQPLAFHGFNPFQPFFQAGTGAAGAILWCG